MLFVAAKVVIKPNPVTNNAFLNKKTSDYQLEMKTKYPYYVSTMMPKYYKPFKYISLAMFPQFVHIQEPQYYNINEETKKDVLYSD